MAQKPISRHYDYGCTFRWIQGDGHIAVKRGYVREGQASVVVRAPGTTRVQDRPGENPHVDQHTWIAAIPVNPGCWREDQHFTNAVDSWVQQHPGLVDMTDRTRRHQR